MLFSCMLGYALAWQQLGLMLLVAASLQDLRTAASLQKLPCYMSSISL